MPPGALHVFVGRTSHLWSASLGFLWLRGGRRFGLFLELLGVASCDIHKFEAQLLCGSRLKTESHLEGGAPNILLGRYVPSELKPDVGMTPFSLTPS